MYQLLITRYAQKQLQKLSPNAYNQIIGEIYKLKNNPRPFGYIKLKSEEVVYRIRSGDYRVLYEIKDKIMTVIVIEVGNRKDAY